MEQVPQGVPVYFVNENTAYHSYVGGITRAHPHSTDVFRGVYISKGKTPVP
jgi:hypothetical protein